jgi:hypothetical protein
MGFGPRRHRLWHPLTRSRLLRPRRCVRENLSPQGPGREPMYLIGTGGRGNPHSPKTAPTLFDHLRGAEGTKRLPVVCSISGKPRILHAGILLSPEDPYRQGVLAAFNRALPVLLLLVSFSSVYLDMGNGLWPPGRGIVINTSGHGSTCFFSFQAENDVGSSTLYAPP